MTYKFKSFCCFLISCICMAYMQFSAHGFENFEDVLKLKKPIATSLTMTDGVVYFKTDDTAASCGFVYRPYLSGKPPVIPFRHLWGLNGSMELNLSAGGKTENLLTRTNLRNMQRKPYHLLCSFDSSPDNAGDESDFNLELLSAAGQNAMLYSLANNSSQPARLQIKIRPRQERKGLYTLVEGRRNVDMNVSLGDAVYAYDSEKMILWQSYDDPLADRAKGLDPVSGLVFNSKPQNFSLKSSYPADGFLADLTVPAKSSVSFFYFFSDNRPEAESAISGVRAFDFEYWKKDTVKHWDDYVSGARARIEKTLDVSLDKLSDLRQKQLAYNLVEVRSLLSRNGAIYASPAAVFYYSSNSVGYWQSYVRDDSIALLDLTEIGLIEEYMRPHAELVMHNYNQGELTNGFHRWWDQFYFYRQNMKTDFSQVDSAFYGIWSLYKAWQQLGDDRYVTGDAYELMKDNIKYYTTGAAYDPHKDKNITYYDKMKNMYREYLINEADITEDPNGVWGDTKEWYRSPTTNKKFHFVNSFYINVLFHANYSMMAEIAQYNNNQEDRQHFVEQAQKLKKNINKELWREDKGRFIAGIAYNEDGWEDIDFDWYNIGFDYIWALTLPDEKHLPFKPEVKTKCLEAAYEHECWDNTVFGAAEVASDLDSARKDIVNRIFNDALSTKTYNDYVYFFPGIISECFGNATAPQIFAISPSINALCRSASKE
jgi:hypothetical protein